MRPFWALFAVMRSAIIPRPRPGKLTKVGIVQVPERSRLNQFLCERRHFPVLLAAQADVSRQEENPFQRRSSVEPGGILPWRAPCT
jgi:hypothetical protein